MTNPFAFVDPDPAKRTNEVAPGNLAGGGGMIETVKRAVILALRDALTGSTLNGLINGSAITVDMEYPMKPERYPGIWVQFSFSKIQNAGMGHELLLQTVENEGTPEEWVNWEPVREFVFEGRCALTVVALTSLERDRTADAVITMLAFSRSPEQVITLRERDAKKFRQLIDSLANNPYVSMSINHDIINPGGQAMTTGVPWDDTLPGYEDTYSFDLIGQSNIVFRNDGTFSLRAVVSEGKAIAPDPYTWQ